MAKLAELVNTIREVFPDVEMMLIDNLPTKDTEAGWIDFPADESVCIEYISSRGFGLHIDITGEDSLGDHPSEVYQDVPSVINRLKEFGGIFHLPDK